MEALEEEEEKRTGWLWENALRRHNFVGFVGELLKGVVKDKLGKGEGEYDKWIEDAKKKTQRRAEERRKQGISGDDVE